MTDTTTLTGAEFREHVGTDPAKWAEAFVRACDRDGHHEMLRDERAAYATQWFRDAMDAAVAHAQASHQKILAERLVPRQESVMLPQKVTLYPTGMGRHNLHRWKTEPLTRELMDEISRVRTRLAEHSVRKSEIIGRHNRTTIV